MELKEESSNLHKKYQIPDDLFQKIIDLYITEDGWPTEHEAFNYYFDLPAILHISFEEVKTKAICSAKEFKRAVQRYWLEQKKLGNDLPWEDRYKSQDRIIDREILSKIIKKWGKEHQMRLAQEECKKLLSVIEIFFHEGNKDNMDNIGQLIGQVATVKIMIAQMEIILGYEKIQSQVIRKANTLKGQLQMDKMIG